MIEGIIKGNKKVDNKVIDVQIFANLNFCQKNQKGKKV